MPSPDDLPQPSSRAHRWGWRPLLRAAAATASLVLFARVVVLGADGVGAALAALWRQQPAAIAGVLALVAAWVVALAEVQRATARALGADLSHRDALRISRSAFTLSRVVPGGGAAGGVFAVRELARMGHRPGIAGGTALVSWAVTSSAFAVVVAVASVLTLRAGLLPAATVVPAAAGLLAIAAAGATVLWTLHRPQVRARLVARLQPPAGPPGGGLRRAAAAARRAAAAAVADLDERERPLSSLRVASGWAVTAYVLEAALLWSVFAAVGAPLPLAVVAAGFLSAGVLNSLPEMTPGWIGVYETAMAATYTALGIPADTALVGVLIHRLVAFWLPVAIGVVPAVRALAAGRRDAAAAPATPVTAAAEAVASAAAAPVAPAAPVTAVSLPPLEQEAVA